MLWKQYGSNDRLPSSDVDVREGAPRVRKWSPGSHADPHNQVRSAEGAGPGGVLAKGVGAVVRFAQGPV
jgi:hypothetical protein